MTFISAKVYRLFHGKYVHGCYFHIQTPAAYYVYVYFDDIKLMKKLSSQCLLTLIQQFYVQSQCKR